METKRPQLSPDELQQLKWLLGGVLTLISVWTVFYLEVEAWTLMGLTTMAVLAAIVWPTWPARVPRLVHTLAFPAIVTFFLGDLWLSGEMLPAIVRLDILLLLYRGISYRQRRDDLQIIVLGLFLVVVAGVLTVSLVFAVQIVAFTGCALAFLLTITLGDPGGGPVKDKKIKIAPNALPAWAAHVEWRRLFTRLRAASDWRLAALGGLLFAGLVGVSALLFLAIPRFQLENSLFLERFIAKKSRSGFNDSIKFGDVTDIQQDTSVALSVDVSDPAQVPASPYWRMLVLDDYREGAFRFSPGLSRVALARERTAAVVNGTERMSRGAPVFWTFYLESGIGRYLPLPGRFRELRFREVQNFRPSAELAIVALRMEPATMTAYRVEGLALADALPDPEFAARWRERNRASATGGALQQRLNLAPEDREVLARVLAEAGSGVGEVNKKRSEVLRGEGTPLTGGVGTDEDAEEFARRVSAWLVKQHGYSLSPQFPKGAGDPLVRWLASREPGHCELFAGSFVVLARTAGFAARVAVGFRGGSWNGYSNNFTVRNSDAHAWAELWDETRGAWLRVDPLAVGSPVNANDGDGAAAGARQLDRSWTARFDSLRVFWYRRIVNFDARSQEETLKAVKTATENTGRRLKETVERVAEDIKAWLLKPWDMRRVAGMLAAVTLLIGAGWAWRKFRFSILHYRWGQHGREDPVRREAGRWLERLREAESNGTTGAEASEMARTRAELQRLRFGARETWVEPATVLRRARNVTRAKRRR